MRKTNSQHMLGERMEPAPHHGVPRVGPRSTAMRAFVRRFMMHYGIYRRYPLRRLPAIRNAWRTARA
jgi:hypothetical protein